MLFLTNAAGGINRSFNAGDFMLITDQISMSVPSPLIGENIDELGVRFPDMSEVYSRRLRKIIENSAVTAGVPLRRGVYIQTTGPQYETPAEIRAYERLGADAVGMSTAIEAIAARHAGMEICGISCISNLAAGISVNPLTHAEVQETADRVAPLFKKLVTQAIKDIHNRLKILRPFSRRGANIILSGTAFCSPVFLPDIGYTDIGNIVCSGSAAVLAEVGVRRVDLSAGAFPGSIRSDSIAV